MADRSILFSNFNSPEAENPGDFESSYNVNAISKALERQQRDIQRKIDQAREKFEEAKNEQAGRFEQNKELTELLSIDPTQYFSAISADLKKMTRMSSTVLTICLKIILKNLSNKLRPD